ncbi:MAG: DUF692 family multinuclear iron-containing protein [Vampirovibrionales bacterium]
MYSRFLNTLQHLPRLGFGLGFKETYGNDLLHLADDTEWSHQVDWLEIISENYFKPSHHSLQQLQALLEVGFPIIPHGVNLSLGSVTPLNTDYLKHLEALFTLTEPLWFSDHLCFSSYGGHHANDLLPLPINEESAEQCIKNILYVKERFDIPFLVEHVSTYIEMCEPGWNEASWIRYIVQEADCGLLLDLNNVFVNTQNHGGDAYQYIHALPLEHVVEIHMAGHLKTKDLLIDTHGEPICDEVFSLFSYALPRCKNLKGVLLERDSHLPNFEALLAELAQLRILHLESCT